MSGAAIVVSRAKKLHMPIAVAEKRVGNSSALAKYTKLNELETPILHRNINTGIKNNQAFTKSIFTPPKSVTPKQTTNDALMLSFSYS